MEGKVEVTNDINSRLIVQVVMNEGPDNYYGEEGYDYEVIINESLCFYFNTAEEFHDWIRKLNEAFREEKK